MNRTCSLLVRQTAVATTITRGTARRLTPARVGTTLAPATSAMLLAQRTLFTNKKAYRGPVVDEQDRKEREASENFFDKKVESEKDILPSRKAEEKLASKQQLEEELPTGEELEKALKEGRMDQFVTESSDTVID